MSRPGGDATAPVGAEERVGPYRLIRRLGQGGMGIVYLAEGPDRAEVALKVLRPHVAQDPTARARLEREVATLARVNHPGVAGIVAHHLTGDRPYLVTRFVPGRPLDEQVEERGPLTPQRWLPVAGCLAESLQAIHRAGVIHRDLKPGNVMMSNGRPVLIDFGIAQAADDLRLTQTGLVIGTPGYLAPELIEGELVSESADWWGWAATVSYAATGRRPFGKGPFEAVLSRVHSGQADLEGVDPRLRPLLAAALSPDRRDRPTQLEIMTGLNRYAEGRDALVPPTTATTPVAMHPPTAVMTRVVPETDKLDPANVALLVPAVIPPLSAFAPLRDKLREVAAQQKAAYQERAALQQASAVPTHPATYSPAPGAAAPPPMPLTYQGAPVPAGGPAPTTYQPPQYTPTRQYDAPARPYPDQSGASRRDLPATRSERAMTRPAPDRPPTPLTGLLLTLLLALTALIAVFPVLGTVVVFVLMVLARAVDRSSTALLRRREARGHRGRSDGVVALASSPMHLVGATVVSLPAMILPLLAATGLGLAAMGILSVAEGSSWSLLTPVSTAIGGACGLLAAWRTLGGGSLRRGTKVGLRTLFRPRWLNALVTVALLVVAVLLAGQAGSGTDWGPLADLFRLPELPSLPSLPSLPGPDDLPVIRDLPIIGN